jgi:hypothetical protein
MSEFFYGSFLRVRENRIIITNEPVQSYCRKPREHENLVNDREFAYQGYLSFSACKTIEKRLTCWFSSMFVINRDSINTGKVRSFMPVMVTVTLSSPQKHDDKWIKRNILQEFLKALQRKKDIRFTFWKAEAQLNGNIHFHILIDRYVDKKFIQGLWNYYQKKAGYMDKYFSEHQHYNSPSTHVEGMRSDKSPIKYVLKYLQKKGVKKQNCKQSEAGCKLVVAQFDQIRRPIDGAVFRFSKPLITLTPPAIYDDIDILRHLYETQSPDKFRLVHCDYCDIVYTQGCKAYDLLPNQYKRELDDYYRDVYDKLYNPQPPSLYSVGLKDNNVINSIMEQLSLFDANLLNTFRSN